MMMDKRKYFWPLLALVAVVQIGVLGKMISDRVSLIENGREVILPVQPVDPRDFMRGDYVVLGYEVSAPTLREENLGRPVSGFRPGQEVFAVWSPDGKGGWQVKSVDVSLPERLGVDEIAVKATLRSIWGASSAGVRLNLRYGIESYFVPEGEGRTLEKVVRDKQVQAIVAVGGDGTAALKGLVVGGERRVDPPLL